MSFYSDASVVMIPSGYKTSKVYCAVPTDGAADLSFSRSNDTATRVGPDGLIEKVRTNLITYSQAFDNAAWTKGGVGTYTSAVTTGFTDPTGGSNAQRWLATIATTSDRAFVRQLLTLTNGIPYNVSFWIKSNTASAQELYVQFQGGAVATVTATTSWTRVSYTQTTSVTSVFVGVDAKQLATDVLIYGYQVEVGDVATDYIATTTAAVSVGPVSGLPRLDYLNSTCPRLLLEPQRTNLINYSEQFSQWVSVNFTLTQNFTTSPDGYQNADKFAFDASADSSCYKSVSGSSAIYSISIFAKYVSGGKYLYIFSPTNSESAKVWFDIEAGTVANQISGFTGAIENYGNGWFRCTLTNTSNKSLDYFQFGISSTSSSRTLSAASVSYFWGAQVEAGAYATSYIPTLGAAVTRGADACSKTGISSLIGQTAGTVFVDFEFSGSKDSFWPVMTVMGASSAELIEIYGSAGSNSVGVFMLDNGVAQFSQSRTLTVGRHKLAISYELNNTVAYLDGTIMGSVDTSCTIPTMTEIALGKFSYSSAYTYGDRINQALLFKTRLSNADLASLTA